VAKYVVQLIYKTWVNIFVGLASELMVPRVRLVKLTGDFGKVLYLECSERSWLCINGSFCGLDLQDYSIC
jgi:hypothetical protein